MHMDGNLLTGACDTNSREEYLSTMQDLFMHNDDMDQAA